MPTASVCPHSLYVFLPKAGMLCTGRSPPGDTWKRLPVIDSDCVNKRKYSRIGPPSSTAGSPMNLILRRQVGSNVGREKAAKESLSSCDLRTLIHWVASSLRSTTLRCSRRIPWISKSVGTLTLSVLQGENYCSIVSKCACAWEDYVTSLSLLHLLHASFNGTLKLLFFKVVREFRQIFKLQITVSTVCSMNMYIYIYTCIYLCQWYTIWELTLLLHSNSPITHKLNFIISVTVIGRFF